MTMIKSPIFLHLLLLFIPQLLPAHAQSARFLFQSCSGAAGNYTAGSIYEQNLKRVLNSIATSGYPIVPGFYNFSSGRGPDRVNGFGLCRGDTGLDDCRGCIANTTRRILEVCPNQKEAVGYYDFCTIRYSNRPIFGMLDTSPTYYICNTANVSDTTRFGDALDTLMTRLKLAVTAKSSGRKYAQGLERQGFKTIYGLLQCSPALSKQLCDECLERSISQIPVFCGGKLGGKIISPSCYLRYETYRFYSEDDPPQPPPPPPPQPQPQPPPPPPVVPAPSSSFEGNGGSDRRVSIVVVPLVGSIAILIGCIFFCYRRKKKKRSKIRMQMSHQNDTTDEIINDGALQFDFETIRAATNDFARENKLGQGGFGAVYKGTLLWNGQDIAVKRLAKDSGQGDLEFKNEVNLVAKLQHRNLVRLLGYCLEGTERLLVYEFVPNTSLNHFLFRKGRDSAGRTHLDWERRSKIIRGIARGLLYLHEDSRLRIIHRDLKTSNIILDSEMNPKIADFGLARLFHMDETEGSTNRIVGTYGYMASEYAMHGEFSVKSDVFSFGVLLLEIVSG